MHKHNSIMAEVISHKKLTTHSKIFQVKYFSAKYMYVIMIKAFASITLSLGLPLVTIKVRSGLNCHYKTSSLIPRPIPSFSTHTYTLKKIREPGDEVTTLALSPGPQFISHLLVLHARGPGDGGFACTCICNIKSWSIEGLGTRIQNFHMTAIILHSILDLL